MKDYRTISYSHFWKQLIVKQYYEQIVASGSCYLSLLAQLSQAVPILNINCSILFRVWNVNFQFDLHN